MADLDELALSMPHTTKEVSADGRPSYLAHGKLFCCHRSRRRDATDRRTGERLDDVLMFRVADLGVKELLLADVRSALSEHPFGKNAPKGDRLASADARALRHAARDADTLERGRC
jgi:hypothetical protein